jgi:hypothetical protein
MTTSLVSSGRNRRAPFAFKRDNKKGLRYSLLSQAEFFDTRVQDRSLLLFKLNPVDRRRQDVFYYTAIEKHPSTVILNEVKDLKYSQK